MKETNLLYNNKRVFYYDFLRCLAIVFVIFCHCIENVYINTYDLSTQSQVFRISLFTLGRLGVPIFFFLTGSLVLKKNLNDDKSVKKFYKHNLLSLLVTLEIWIVIYSVFNEIMFGDFNIKDLFYNVLFIKPVNNMVHLWYMTTIIGIYIAIPFISKIINSFSPKYIFIAFVISFVASFVVPTINVFCSIFNFDNYSFLIDVSFLGNCYGLYPIIGYYLDNGILKKIKIKYLILVLVIFFIITVWVQLYSIRTIYIYGVWYNFVPLLICACSFFEIIRRIFSKKCSFPKLLKKFITELSKISLAIYFFHLPILFLCKKFIILSFSKPIIVCLLFIMTLIISIFIIEILSRNRICKKYLLMIK